MCGIRFVTSSELHPSWTSVILWALAVILYMISMSGFSLVIIPFNIEQLMGSSSEELNTIIYC